MQSICTIKIVAMGITKLGAQGLILEAVKQAKAAMAEPCPGTCAKFSCAVTNCSGVLTSGNMTVVGSLDQPVTTCGAQPQAQM